MNVKARQAIERRIIRSLALAAINAGYCVAVNNGEDFACQPCRDIGLIMDSLMQTDEDYLYVTENANSLSETKPNDYFGWVRLVYGNDGYDVICDYTTNLEFLLAEPNKIAEEYD